MADTNKTVKEIASDFSAMGDSEQLIKEVIAGNQMANESVEDKKDAVKRNVEHLEQKKLEKTVLDNTVSVWTNEDFTAIDAAIEAGNRYIAV
jgi:predicted transcriptional regulator